MRDFQSAQVAWYSTWPDVGGKGGEGLVFSFEFTDFFSSDHVGKIWEKCQVFGQVK